MFYTKIWYLSPPPLISGCYNCWGLWFTLTWILNKIPPLLHHLTNASIKNDYTHIYTHTHNHRDRGVCVCVCV